MKDYYKILGVEPNATLDKIRESYKKLSLKYHPDRKGGDKEKFQELNEAYDVISDPEKRKAYDTSSFKKMYKEKLNDLKELNGKTTHYDLLDVSQNANPEQIKQHFNFLSHHFKDSPKRMSSLKEAYRTLSDPKTKAKYDQKLADEKESSQQKSAQFVSYYEVLGVKENASSIEIMAASGKKYREYKDNKEARNYVTKAAETLSNPSAKKAYDMELTKRKKREAEIRKDEQAKLDQQAKKQQEEKEREALGAKGAIEAHDGKLKTEAYFNAHEQVTKRRGFISKMKRMFMGEYVSKRETRAINMVASGMNIDKAMIESKKNKGYSR